MSPERAREIGDDAARDEQQRRVTRHTCQIAEYPTNTFTRPAPPCGRTATHWSDDVKDGLTIWMCEEHTREFLMRADESAEAHGVDDDE